MVNPLKITFEDDGEGQTFAHIWSTDGVFGHAKEIQERIPKGTWLSVPVPIQRLVPWLVKKCGFKHIARVVYEGEVLDVLRKV